MEETKRRSQRQPEEGGQEENILGINLTGARLVRHRANCHMPWQRSLHCAAQGAVLSLAPHPALVQTHLAPCWTFIRPVLHQMLPCLGSGALWPFAGEEARLWAQRGPRWELQDDRCQRDLMPSHPFCWHSVAWDLRGKEETKSWRLQTHFKPDYCRK